MTHILLSQITQFPMLWSRDITKRKFEDKNHDKAPKTLFCKLQRHKTKHILQTYYQTLHRIWCQTETKVIILGITLQRRMGVVWSGVEHYVCHTITLQFRCGTHLLSWLVAFTLVFYSGTESIRASVCNTSAATAATARFLISS